MLDNIQNCLLPENYIITCWKHRVMNFKTTATLICTGLLLFGCATSQPDHSSLLSEWKIPIDQPIRQLEEILTEKAQYKARLNDIEKVISDLQQSLDSKRNELETNDSDVAAVNE